MILSTARRSTGDMWDGDTAPFRKRSILLTARESSDWSRSITTQATTMQRSTHSSKRRTSPWTFPSSLFRGLRALTSISERISPPPGRNRALIHARCRKVPPAPVRISSDLIVHLPTPMCSVAGRTCAAARSTPAASAERAVAVGTTVTRRPPHRSVRAELLHTALALGRHVKRSFG